MTKGGLTLSNSGELQILAIEIYKKKRSKREIKRQRSHGEETEEFEERKESMES